MYPDEVFYAIRAYNIVHWQLEKGIGVFMCLCWKF